MSGLEIETINELERHVLTSMISASTQERRAGYEGWLTGNKLPEDWRVAVDRLIGIGLIERQSDDPQWMRATESAENLIAQIEATETTKQ